MNFRTLPVVATVLFVCGVLAPSGASAAFVGLTTPLTGSNAGTSFVDLQVDFDLNGSPADNLVGLELYVEFTGLVPSLYTLGSVFLPDFALDIIETNGACSDPAIDCNYPLLDPDSPTHYLSSVNVFAPAQPTGPGGLFTLRFAIDPSATDWSLNLFGEEGVALLSDPCDPSDPTCVLPPLPIAFLIGTPGSFVPSGVARVDVSASTVAATPPVVPEPGTLLLVGTGVVTLMRRRMRRQGR